MMRVSKLAMLLTRRYLNLSSVLEDCVIRADELKSIDKGLKLVITKPPSFFYPGVFAFGKEDSRTQTSVKIVYVTRVVKAR